MKEFETSALFIKNKSVPEIALLYRRLCGLEKAVSLMGFEPHAMADFALSESDQFWVFLALRVLPYGLLHCDAKELSGEITEISGLHVSEAGVEAMREMLQRLELPKKTEIHAGNFQAQQA